MEEYARWKRAAVFGKVEAVAMKANQQSKLKALCFVLGVLLGVAGIALVGLVFTRPARSNAEQRECANPAVTTTPSQRLAGRWKAIDTGAMVIYEKPDPELKIGVFRLQNTCQRSPGPPFRYKVVTEDPSGTMLVIREFKDHVYMQLQASTGVKLIQSDIVCEVSMDGQRMSREYTLNERRVSTVYRKMEE